MLRAMTRAAPIGQVTVLDFERKLGASLPDDYRRFLVEHNGGRPQPTAFRITWHRQPWARRFPFDDVDLFYGIGRESPNELWAKRESYRGRVPEDTMPIGQDPGGNLLLLGIEGPRRGQVLFWVRDYEVPEGDEPDDRNVGIVAPSFTALLEALADE